MVRAADQHIPLEWTLEDLLEYLTLAPFGHEIDAALREMERAIATGDLPLIDEEYVDGKLKRRYRLDPFYFRKNYNLEFDRHLVRVVPRQREFRWGKSILHFYLLFEQDALRVWPRRPPAPKTTPDQQPEDKAGPDPFKTGAAGRPTAAFLIKVEAERRIAEKEVMPTQGGLAASSEGLEEWWASKRLTFDPPGPPMKAGSISNAVRELWNAALGAQN